jgi:hypothetical protein
MTEILQKVSKIARKKANIDKSWIDPKIIARRHCCLLIMDENTISTWSFLLKNKRHKLCFKQIQNAPKVKIKYISCNNPSEDDDI